MHPTPGGNGSLYRTAFRNPALIGLALFCGVAPLVGAQRNSGPARPSLQDGREILQKTINTYQAMSSYEGQSNVDKLTLNQKGEVIQQSGSSAKIRYKRPNKLMLDFTTPVGSRSLWSDGSTLVVYDALSKKYTIGPTAPNLTAMLPLLYRRSAVTASFDPLFCLSQKTLPKELTGLTLQGTTTFNGHPVYVVTGILNGIGVTNAKKQAVTLPTSTWTWWIDKSTFLIHKIEARTPNVVQAGSTKVGQNQAATTLLMRHTISYSKPNITFPENAFVFKAPPDASLRSSP